MSNRDVCVGLDDKSATIAASRTFSSPHPGEHTNLHFSHRDIVETAKEPIAGTTPQPVREAGTSVVFGKGVNRLGEEFDFVMSIKTVNGKAKGKIERTVGDSVEKFEGEIKYLENDIPTAFNGFYPYQFGKNKFRVQDPSTGLPIKDIDLGRIKQLDVVKGELALNNWECSITETAGGIEIVDRVGETVTEVPYRHGKLGVLDLQQVEALEAQDLNNQFKAGPDDFTIAW